MSGQVDEKILYIFAQTCVQADFDPHPVLMFSVLIFRVEVPITTTAYDIHKYFWRGLLPASCH